MSRPPTQVPTVLLALSAIAAALAVATAGPSSAAGADRDCADFSSQAQAQEFFERHGGPGEDPHRLDADGDGIACESNPCPCREPGEGGGGGGDEGGRKPDEAQAARVVRAIDGDTIEARVKGKRRDVRLIGIDTPEVFGGEECGGAEASESMGDLLSRGTRVSLIRDRSQDNRDRFGRLLRYVERRGRDVGKRQIARGWAEVFVFESPFRRVKRYRRAERRAEEGSRGVWGQCGGDFHMPL